MVAVWKDAIAPGTYWLRGTDAAGKPYYYPWEISRADIDQFYRTCKDRQAAGLPTPIPLDHQPDIGKKTQAELLAYQTSHNTGFVDDWEVSPEGVLRSLVNVVWLPDAKNDDEIRERLEKTIKFVSPYWVPHEVDGAGREWVEPITHLALTPYPIWTSQDSFQAHGKAAVSSSRLPGPVSMSMSSLWHTSPAVARVLQMDAIDWPVAMAAERAPKGGIEIAGTFYPGGRWIPSAQVEKASPSEKAALTRNANEGKERLRSSVALAKNMQAKGNLPVKGGADAPVIASDASGKPIKRYVALPNGARVHPDELQRLKTDKDGTVHLDPNEQLTVIEGNMFSGARILKPVGMSQDATGHEHKGAGPGGGQFVSKEEGESKATTDSGRGEKNPTLPDISRPYLNSREIEAVQEYIAEDSNYDDINTRLRAGGSAESEYLQHAINKAGILPDPITVNRGLDFEDDNDAENYVAKLKGSLDSGEPLTEEGFVSSSTGRPFPGNIQLKIKASHGLDASFYGYNRSEFLMPAGSQFKVLSVTTKGTKTTAVLEQIVERPKEKKMSGARGASRIQPARAPLTRPVQMSKGAPPMADENKDDLYEEEDMGGGDGGGDSEVEEEEEGAEDMDDKAQIAKAAQDLQSLDLIVEPCDDPMEFIRHICTAVKTKAAHEAGGEGEGEPPVQPTPEQPQFMAMSKTIASLTNRVKILSQDKADRVHGDVVADIDALLAGEFIDETLAKEWKTKIGAKKMSLVSNRDPEVAQIKATVEIMRKQLDRKAVVGSLLRSKIDEAVAMSGGARRAATPVRRPAGQWKTDKEAEAAAQAEAEKCGAEMAGMLGYSKK